MADGDRTAPSESSAAPAGVAAADPAADPSMLPDVDVPAAEWIVPPPPAAELPRQVDKPWGGELIWAWTSRYVGKILTLEAGRRLSLQYHEHKDEWIHVLDGRLRLTLQNEAGVVETHDLGPGEGAHVRPGRTHRYEAIETCHLVEVSTPELDDVVRLSDDYGREGTSAP